jgi:hypothetical protein
MNSLLLNVLLRDAAFFFGARFFFGDGESTMSACDGVPCAGSPAGRVSLSLSCTSRGSLLFLGETTTRFFLLDFRAAAETQLRQ